MKEILKYLRTINSYSQEEVSQAIGLSRQSYNKYEAGTVIPSEKILQKLADFYKIEPAFIKANKLPPVPGKDYSSSTPVYTNLPHKDLYVTEKTSSYTADSTKPYDAYMERGNIVFTTKDFPFREGQRLKITIQAESEEEELARKEKAWEDLMNLIGKFKVPSEWENLSYDEIRYRILEEKYGPF